MKRPYGVLPILAAILLSPLESRAGEWGLEFGVAGYLPPHEGSDAEVFALPFPYYRGERLSVDLGSISYALTSSENVTVAVEGRIRFEGYDPESSTALAGMEERDPTFDAGFSVVGTYDWGIASLRVAGDVLGVHEGVEVTAAYQYPIELEHWTLIPSVAAQWRSANLVEYYYGVRSGEARDGRPAYSGKSVVNTSLGATALRHFNSHWGFVAGAEYVRLGDGIKDSPIIDKDYEATVYSAVVYRF